LCRDLFWKPSEKNTATNDFFLRRFTDPMKIYIKDLQEEEVLLLEESLDPNAAEFNIGIMRFPEPLKLSVRAWKSGDEVVVSARMTGRRLFNCSRCLEEFNNLFEKEATLYYDIGNADFISIDQEIRDEILLDHPIRVFCREDCRGLCPTCGTNLNAGQCRCARP
jgi:uncharacterized protein